MISLSKYSDYICLCMERTSTRKIHPPQSFKNDLHLLLAPLLLRSRPNCPQIIPSLSICSILNRNSTISKQPRKHSLQTPSVFERWFDIPRLRDPKVDSVQTSGRIWYVVEGTHGFGLGARKSEVEEEELADGYNCLHHGGYNNSGIREAELYQYACSKVKSREMAILTPCSHEHAHPPSSQSPFQQPASKPPANSTAPTPKASSQSSSSTLSASQHFSHT